MPLPPFLAISSMPRSLLVCGGALAMFGVGLTVYSAVAEDAAHREAPVCIQLAAQMIAPPVIAPPAPAPIRDPRADEVKLVFTAGGASYIKLADVGNREADSDNRDDGADRRDSDRHPDGLATPRHGALKHVQDDYVHAAVAPVAVADVPMLYASWLGRKFRIDGGCEASIVSFAVVSRLSGEPSYAGVDDWSARSVMKAGQPVLAAKLDGCTGTLARDASLSPIVFPDKRHDAALEQAARAALLGSALASQTQRAWDVQVADLGSAPSKWTTDAEISTQVLHHPKTGETFVSAQAQVAAGCGAPEANIWALYRVTDHGLVPVEQRTMSEIQTIEQLVDIDGDGAFELIGTPWINNEQVIVRPTGERLESLATPFFGCPC